MNAPVRLRAGGWSACVLAALSIVIPVLSHARPLDPVGLDEMNRRLADLQHTPWNGQFKEKPTDEDMWGTCLESKVKLNVTDPLNGATKQIAVRLVRPNVKKPVPVVVVIPTIEGVTPLEPEIASQFCSAKMATLIADVNNPEQPKELPSWGIEDEHNRDAILQLRTVIDFAEHDPRFEPKKIGMMGLSLGGIITAMMAGIEPDRLRAVVVAVGGGNIPYILANSDNSKVAELRRRRLEHLGSSDVAQYEEKLRETVRFDPFFFASRANRDRLLMVMAEQDTKVPYLIQQEQFAAFRKPDSMIFSGGHVGTLISLTYVYLDTVIEFLQARFDGKFGIVGQQQLIKIDNPN